MQKLHYIKTAAVLQLMQTIITVYFVITSNTPTNVLNTLPAFIEVLSLASGLGIMVAPIVAVVTFYHLQEGKRAGEKSKWRIPILIFAIINAIIGVIWIGMWAILIIGALSGDIHV